MYNDFGLQAVRLLYRYRYVTDRLQFIFLLCTWSKLSACAKRRLEMKWLKIYFENIRLLIRRDICVIKM